MANEKRGYRKGLTYVHRGAPICDTEDGRCKCWPKGGVVQPTGTLNRMMRRQRAAFARGK